MNQSKKDALCLYRPLPMPKLNASVLRACREPFVHKTNFTATEVALAIIREIHTPASDKNAVTE